MILDKYRIKGNFKYRYLFDFHNYKDTLDGDTYTGDSKYNLQSMDFILSGLTNFGKNTIEVGIQAENWLSKHENAEKWNDWPEEWEFMLFLRWYFSNIIN